MNSLDVSSAGRLRTEPLIPDQGGRQNSAPPMLLHYWHVILRWKWIILGIVAVALLLGFVATLLTTPQYTSTSRVEIQREKQNITNVEDLEAPESGRNEEFYQTQYSLLTARSLAERVVRMERLASNDAFFAAHGVDPSSLGDGSQGGGGRRQLSERENLAAALLLQNVSISPIRQSRLVDVSYTSGDRDISAQIANAWVAQFIQASMDRRFSSTVDARKYLEGQLAELRQKVEQSERDLVNYASRQGIVALSTSQSEDGKTTVQQTLVTANLQALNTALAEATAARIAAESSARAGGPAGSSPDELASSALSQLRQKRAEVQSEYAKMLANFEPGYPPVIALAEQVRSLDAAIGREEGRIKAGRSGRYQEERAREDRLRAQVEALRNANDQQQRASIQYNIYQREADTNRELYDALLQRYKEIGVAGVAANNIAVVDRAEASGSPSSPNLFLNLALALLAGLVLAAGATFVLEQLDEGLRSPADVSRRLGVPLLGTVPDVETSLDDIIDVKSDLADAYLTIRSSLALATDHGVPRSFMVTSTRPAEGKSTSALALGFVLSRTGRKVVLIDSDMRRPSLHMRLSVDNMAGLSNYLAGDDDWRRLTHTPEGFSVDFISAGPTPPNAAELLSGDRLAKLVKELLTEYDQVIIDGPPLLGFADAQLLSRVAEGCIFVVQSEGAPLRAIQASIERLRGVQAHIFGAILTKVSARGMNYGYGYGYGYGRTYGHDTDDEAGIN